MSHELRTPMNAILGMTKLALNTDLNEEQKDLLTTVDGAAESLLSILNTILDFARIEANRVELECVPFRMKEVVTGVLKLLAVKAEEKRIIINHAVSPDVPERLKGDPLRIGQIVTNLIANAIKFTEQDGVVALQVLLLATTDSECELKLIVADNGIGIAPELQEKIFEEFRQAEQSTSRRFGGSGLGLTIAKKLTEAMGGNLHLVNSSSSGTTFVATIRCGRCLEEAPADSHSTQHHTLLPPAKKMTILIAEDNPVNFHLARKILEKRGHTVLHAENGREAILVLRERAQEIDVVLMDCQMPEVDGFEATAIIRQSKEPFSQIPIIALTANAYPSDRAKCLDAGMNSYISKPFEHGAFVELVEKTGGAG